MYEIIKKSDDNNSKKEGEIIIIRKTWESSICDEKQLNNNLEINRI